MPRYQKLFLLTLIAALACFGQVTGRVTGTVVDPAGASVPNAKVSLLLMDGKTALLTGTTTAQGTFDFIAVRPETYRIEVETAGFAKYAQAGIKVDPARETSVPTITLSLASSTQTIEVSTAVTSVETTTAEVSSTVTQSQVMNLPVLDRQLTSLFYTQAGVTSNLRENTVINGLRPSYTNITLDGINLQDSVRTNAIDYMPNKLTIAQVAEFTVASSNANLTIGGGASTIIMTTPSGSNDYHGSGYWYNRYNSAKTSFAANDWFSNKNGVAPGKINLNQLGATVGGRIIRDKLFFYTAYEAYRLKRQAPITNTILTPTARQGILQYRNGNAVEQFDVLKASGLSINPAVRDMLAKIPAVGNSNDVGDGLNTTGYSFNARRNTTRDNLTFKGDYQMSPRNAFSMSYLWNRDLVDRTDYRGFYDSVPAIFNDNKSGLLSASWRWNPTPTLVNELRGGYSRTPSTFESRQANPAWLPSGTIYTAPYVTQLPEGRTVNTYILQDNANLVKNKHSFSFGFQTNQLRTKAYVYGGTVPTLTVGISTASPYGFSAGQIPGANSAFTNVANNLLASLGGLVSSAAQTFNATSPKSGYVPGAPSGYDMVFNQYATYFVDTFKVRRNLTLTFGVRWDMFSPLDEKNGLIVNPVTVNNNPIATLAGNVTLDLFGGPTGRQLYKRDKNNFAPNIGFAWDVTGNHKTAIRGGYSIAYVNDNLLNSIANSTIYVNPGLSSSITRNNLNARLDAPPSVTPPAFAIPITAKAFYDNTPSSPSVFGMVDPNLAIPYVQQWSLGIQHEFKGFIAEGRYVGNHAVKIFRNLDLNQINVFQGDFLADFKRARNNGFLSLAAGKGFAPAYNPDVAGSQQLTFFPKLSGGGLAAGGLLTNATVQSYLRSGEIGTLAQTYQSNLYFPSAGFSYFPNPLALYESYMTNSANSTYNGAQFEIRKNTRSGVTFQSSYTFSKSLSDATSLRGLDPALDNNNPKLEKSRPTYDLTHSFKMNHYLPLPFGPGRTFSVSNPILQRIVGGWGMSGILFVQSGSPVSIFSARGTLNRGARSGNNTVDTNLNLSQLKEKSGLFMTGNGPYWFDPKNIGNDGRAVAADGSAAFDGQVFFQPQPGTVGSLGRRVLDGPGYWNYNFALLKETKIREKHSLQFGAYFYNLFNHPNFYLSDQTVTSSTFGRITSQNYSNDSIGPRALQFSLYYRF
jgi:hypothetical protein